MFLLFGVDNDIKIMIPSSHNNKTRIRQKQGLDASLSVVPLMHTKMHNQPLFWLIV
jgi:hypothetical protein